MKYKKGDIAIDDAGHKIYIESVKNERYFYRVKWSDLEEVQYSNIGVKVFDSYEHWKLYIPTKLEKALT